jgi:hypothetical protein
MYSWVSGTKVFICGKKAALQKPVGLPLPTAPTDCFTKNSYTLSKRGSTSFSTTAGDLICTWDDKYKRPFQDCFNALGMLCQSGSPLFVSISDCRKKITTIASVLNGNWQNYVNKCANWISGGNYNSGSCSSAISTILKVETYNMVLEDGSIAKENISPAFVESVKPIFL